MIRRTGLVRMLSWLVVAALVGTAHAEPVAKPKTQVLRTRLGSKYWYDRHVAARELAERGRQGRAALVEALKSKDRNALAAAADRLARMGVEKKAVVESIVAAASANPWLPTEARWTLVRLGADAVGPLVTLLDHKKEDQRRFAVAVLSGMPADTPGLVDAFIRALACPQRAAHDASEALAALGKPAMAPLARVLRNDPSSARRYYAAVVLAKVGTDDPAVREALLAALKDKGSGARAVAAAVVPKLGLPAKEAVARLAELVPGKSWRTTEAAAKALATYGPAAKTAMPALKEAYKRHSGPMLNPRIAVVRAMAATEPPPEEALALFVPMLDGGVRQQAALALAKLGPKAAPAIDKLVACLKGWGSGAPVALAKIGLAAVPALTKALGAGSASVRGNAAEALGRIGPPARPAVPKLIERLGADEGPLVRKTAAAAITLIAPKDASVVEALAAALVGAPDDVRRKALACLGHIGPPLGPKAAAAVSKLLTDETRPFLWSSAMQVLVTTAPDSPATRQALLSMTGYVGKDPKPFDRSWWLQREEAAGMLAKLGPRGIATLGEALRGQRVEQRLAAAKALPAATSAAARKLLVAALQDASQKVRSLAAERLAGAGPAAKDAGGALASALKDPSSRVRLEAARALLAIGAERDGAAGALAALLDDRDGWVRLAAGSALLAAGAEEDKAVAALAALARGDPPGKEATGSLSDGALKALVTHASDRADLLDILLTIVGRRTGAQSQAIAAIGRMGPKARKALPVLRKEMSRRFSGLRTAASEAVSRIDPTDKKALAVLIDSISAHRGHAVEALGALGPAARPAIGRLIWAVQSESKLRSGPHPAVGALGQIGAVEPEAVQALLYELGPKEVDEAFLAIAAKSPQTVTPELKWLASTRLSGAAKARELLEKIEAAARP